MSDFSRNRSLPAKIESMLTRIEGNIASLCLLGILAISLLEIGARNFFHSGIPGASSIIQYLVLWVCFFGAVLAVRERHIKIDVATILLSESLRTKLERPIFSFSALVCGALSWNAARFWLDEWQMADTLDEKWIAIMGIVFPLCFGLLTIHFALRVIIGPRAPRRRPA